MDVNGVNGRRRKMQSIIKEVQNMMMESVNTGRPLLNSARFQSLLLHFEADRVRLEGMLFGDIDNHTAVERMRDELCPGDRHDGNVCNRCAKEA